MLESLLKKYREKLLTLQKQYDEDFKNQYFEGCEKAEKAISVLKELVVDLESYEVKDSFNNISNSKITL